MQPIEIFRTGTHRAMDGSRLAFGAAELTATAAAYDPALHEAPIVVGHPASDAPAYGWVQGLAFEEGRLAAAPHQVEPAFAALVEAGRFKKVSASFYTPESEANPKPGVFYLRHVGFLGAQAPAVKGLKPVAFAADDAGIVTVEFGDVSDRTAAGMFRGMREWIVEKFGAEDADKAVPRHLVDFLEADAAQPEAKETRSAFAEAAATQAAVGAPVSSVTEDEVSSVTEDEESDMDKDKAAAEAAAKAKADDLEARQAKFAEREKAHAESVTAFRRQQAEQRVDGLVAQGKVAPGHKPGLVAFVAQLDDGGTITFAETEGGAEKKVSPRAFFEGFLDALPKQIDFVERSAGGKNALDAADTQSVANAAVAYQEEMRTKGVTVSADVAVRHVLKQGA